MSKYVTIPLDVEGVEVDRAEVTRNGEVHLHVRRTVGAPAATGAAGGAKSPFPNHKRAGCRLFD